MAEKEAASSLEEAAYGDLGEAAESAAAGARKVEAELGEMKRLVKVLESELEELRREKRVWAKQRAVLVHNLGAVLKTARVEMGRKDREIERLRKEGGERSRR